MNENIPCRTVEQLESFLQSEYSAVKTEPVDYLLYNARQQVLNIFYPEQMQEIADVSGFSPECSEEESALFDSMVEVFDLTEAQSDYVQYSFNVTALQGAQAAFYVTIERKTGFVLPQFEWAQDSADSQAEPDVSEEDYRFLNRVMRDIVLYQGVSEDDVKNNAENYQRYLIAKEFWDSVC